VSLPPSLIALLSLPHLPPKPRHQSNSHSVIRFENWRMFHEVENLTFERSKFLKIEMIMNWEIWQITMTIFDEFGDGEMSIFRCHICDWYWLWSIPSGLYWIDWCW
jgi:hypothetical protein